MLGMLVLWLKIENLFCGLPDAVTLRAPSTLGTSQATINQRTLWFIRARGFFAFKPGVSTALFPWGHRPDKKRRQFRKAPTLPTGINRILDTFKAIFKGRYLIACLRFSAAGENAGLILARY
jgi:hypothetical protein